MILITPFPLLPFYTPLLKHDFIILFDQLGTLYCKEDFRKCDEHNRVSRIWSDIKTKKDVTLYPGWEGARRESWRQQWKRKDDVWGKQIRNSVSRQQGIGLDKLTPYLLPGIRGNRHAIETEGQRNIWKWILITKGFKKQPRKKFHTSDSVIQLAKEEFSCRVVLSPMDDHSH